MSAYRTENTDKSVQRQTDLYQYEDLPCVESIRILSLKPGRPTDALIVTLETVQGVHVIDRLRSVEALSYVWGDTARTRLIICNGKAFKVTISLESALRAIRQPDVETLLWADAVCIDQDNTQERNHQIKLMTQIYSKAKRVLVWLGPDPDGVGKRAFELAHRLAADTSFAGFMIKNWRSCGDLIRSFDDIASRDWFNRMWTMQEIGLASDATFICGSSRIDWRDLVFAYEFIHETLSRDALHRLSLRPDKVLFLYKWMSTGEDKTFLELLVMSETRQTTDPRDRVFALLSHPSAQHTETHTSPTRLLIEPDYTKSVVAVYTDLAKYLIATSKRLDVLSYVRGHTRTAGLPTWAPMWGQPRQSNCLLGSHLEFAAAGKSDSQYWDNLMTSMLRPYDAQVGSKGYRQTLTVDSVSLGKVAWCSTPARNMEALALSPSSEVKGMWRQIKQAFPSTPAVRLAYRLGNVLTCGLSHPQYVGPDGKRRHADDFAAYWHHIWEPGSETALVTASHKSLHNRSLWRSESRSDESAKPYATAAWYAGEGRVLFGTGKGLIGLGPACMSVGDEVCILKGGRVPYVLRNARLSAWKKGDIWNVIGESYVSGVMQGQLFARRRPETFQFRQMILV